jgi:hypothetical protein
MSDPETTLASLEAPSMIRADGAAPVMAIIEHVSAHECRLRAVNVFEIGARLEFTVSVHGAPTIALSGKVVTRKEHGARHAYVLALATTLAQTEAIAKANDASRHRAANTPDVPTENGLTRAAFRIPVDFDVLYTRAGSTARSARATNISTGGVHMNTSAELPVGSSIEMKLPLGSERIVVNGRVVAHQEMSPNYNVAFYEMSDETREVIAGFIESRTKAA